jgi:hypothetical protein
MLHSGSNSNWHSEYLADFHTSKYEISQKYFPAFIVSKLIIKYVKFWLIQVYCTFFNK